MQGKTKLRHQWNDFTLVGTLMLAKCDPTILSNDRVKKPKFMMWFSNHIVTPPYQKPPLYHRLAWVYTHDLNDCSYRGYSAQFVTPSTSPNSRDKCGIHKLQIIPASLDSCTLYRWQLGWFLTCLVIKWNSRKHCNHVTHTIWIYLATSRQLD